MTASGGLEFKTAPTVKVSLVWGDRVLGESEALLDTGTEFSIANESFMRKLGIKRNMLKKHFGEQVCSASGEYLQGIGILSLKIRYKGNEVEDKVMIVSANLGNPLILNWVVTCRLRNDVTFPKSLNSGIAKGSTGSLSNTNGEWSMLTPSTYHNEKALTTFKLSQDATCNSYNNIDSKRDVNSSPVNMTTEVILRSRKCPLVDVSLVYSDKLFGRSKAIFDTGAEFSIAGESILKRLGITRNMLKKPCMKQTRVINGNSLYNIGVLKTKIRVGGNEVEDDIMIVGAKMENVPLLLYWKVACILRNDLRFPEPLGTSIVVPHVMQSPSGYVGQNDPLSDDVTLPKEFLLKLGYNFL